MAFLIGGYLLTTQFIHYQPPLPLNNKPLPSYLERILCAGTSPDEDKLHAWSFLWEEFFLANITLGRKTYPFDINFIQGIPYPKKYKAHRCTEQSPQYQRETCYHFIQRNRSGILDKGSPGKNFPRKASRERHYDT